MLTTCYFPSGAVADQDVPCNALAPASACCAANDICLDNGFCLAATGTGPNTISRGSCTSAAFAAPACPQRCASVNPDNGALLFLVGLGTNGTYCCNGVNAEGTACAAASTAGGDTSPFELPNARVVTNRTDGSTDPLSRVLGRPAAAAVAYTVTTTLAAATATVTAAGQAAGSGEGENTAKILGGIMAFLVVVLAVVLAAMWQLWNMMRNARREATEARLGNMAMDGGYQADHKDGRGMVQSDGERYEVGTDNIPHELDTGVNHTA